MITISSKLYFQKPIVEGSDVEKFAFYNFIIILYNFQNSLSKFSSVSLFNSLTYDFLYFRKTFQQNPTFKLKSSNFKFKSATWLLQNSVIFKPA